MVFRAVGFKLLVWCGAEGYVSGLQDAAARNTTGSNHCIIPDDGHSGARNMYMFRMLSAPIIGSTLKLDAITGISRVGVV